MENLPRVRVRVIKKRTKSELGLKRPGAPGAIRTEAAGIGLHFLGLGLIVILYLDRQAGAIRI